MKRPLSRRKIIDEFLAIEYSKFDVGNKIEWTIIGSCCCFSAVAVVEIEEEEEQNRLFSNFVTCYFVFAYANGDAK